MVRPDIFNSIGLQNQNTKIRSNSVVLNWGTEYANYRRSDLFRIIDHLISSQQDGDNELGRSWDHYFPWDAPTIKGQDNLKTSFISFLRFSYYRPRDIIMMLMIIQDIFKEERNCDDFIPYRYFDNSTFKRRYSDYLLGEIKDHLIFYYSEEDYQVFLKFFEFLKGKRKFDFKEYNTIFNKFSNSLQSDNLKLPQFMSSDKVFLQFLYDLNVICYYDRPYRDKPYPRWCFIERSYANISPRVKEDSDYEIFDGLYKALNLGQELS